MKRRNFLKKLPILAGAPFVLNGISFGQMSAYPQLKEIARRSANNRAMVIIQLHGGNDGLNAVIPISQYADYYNLRPNVAIPETGSRRYIRLDNTLNDQKLVGLHPDMVGFKDLYDQGKLAIVQNVGYENMNGSHFKGRDIWFGGVGYNDPITSGWMGRYLQGEFENPPSVLYPENFPNAEMPDPLGLEFGNEVSLGFHTGETIPAAISVGNPVDFFDLVEDLEGYNENKAIDKIGVAPASLENSIYKRELDWILNLENDTKDYAERLKNLYNSVSASPIEYPTTYPLNAPPGSLRNPLHLYLRIVARLIQAGCKTKIYLIRIGGFDTHVNQVENYNTTLGAHAALMYHVSASLRAFQADLKERGIEDQVLSCTLSEFGRRARSNGGYGTDHGTVAPMFVVGSQVNPGVIGQNPDLRKAQASGNLSDNMGDFIDYRDTFTEILTKWLEVKPELLPNIFPGHTYANLERPLLRGDGVTNLDDFFNRRFKLKHCFPNPVGSFTTFSFYIDNPAQVKLALYDGRGQLVKNIIQDYRNFGNHEVTVDLSDLRSGIYFYQVEAGLLKDAKKLIKL